MMECVRIPVSWFTKTWFCAARSPRCSPTDPHFSWECGYRYDISFCDHDFTRMCEATARLESK